MTGTTPECIPLATGYDAPEEDISNAEMDSNTRTVSAAPDPSIRCQCDR